MEKIYKNYINSRQHEYVSAIEKYIQNEEMDIIDRFVIQRNNIILNATADKIAEKMSEVIIKNLV